MTDLRTLSGSTLGVAVVALSLVGGCSTGTGAPAGDPSAIPTTTSIGSMEPPSASAPSASAPSASAPSSRPSGAAGAPVPGRCTLQHLAVTLHGGDSAMGTRYLYLRLRNTSTHPCRTGGFGGVSLVRSATGEPLGAPAGRREKDKVRQLTLGPDRRAQARLSLTVAENYDAATCQPVHATGLRVYPPDETHSAFLAGPGLSACANPAVGLLRLSPYRLGVRHLG